MYIHKKI
jgi:hypothetical protein